MNIPFSSLGPRTLPAQWYPLLISAKSESALEAGLGDMARYCASADPASLADISFTLLAGRELFPLRRALVCRDTEDAAAVFAGRYPERLWRAESAARRQQVVFSLSGRVDGVLEGVGILYRTDPFFSDAVNRCMGLVEGLDTSDWLALFLSDDPAADRDRAVPEGSEVAGLVAFIIEYALTASWIGKGLQPAAVIGHGGGEALAAHLSGGLSLEDALAWAKTPGAAPLSLASTILPFRSADTPLPDGKPVVLDIGSGRVVDESAGEDMAIHREAATADGSYWMTRTLAELALRGVAMDWKAYFSNKPVRRIPLPTYRFEPRRHWFAATGKAEGFVDSQSVAPDPVAPAPTRSTQIQSSRGVPITAVPDPRPSSSVEKAATTDRDAIERVLRETCQTLLGIEQITATDNVIQMGMDSLNVMQLSKIVTEIFGVRIAPHHMFTRPNLASLADRIATHDPPPRLPRAAPEQRAEPDEGAPENAAVAGLMEFVTGLSDGEIDQFLRELDMAEEG